MAKVKDRSELEHLRGENKRLKSENRNLKKRNKELERKKHIFEDFHPHFLKPEKKEVEKDYYDCPDCGKGHVKTVIEFTHRYIEACDLCTFRNVVINGKEEEGKEAEKE